MKSVREVTWGQVVSDKWLGSSVSGDLESSGVREVITCDQVVSER